MTTGRGRDRSSNRGSRRRVGYGVGATKWEVTRDVVLSAAMPGIMTGTILSPSRAIGETAPILMIAETSMFTPTYSGLGPFSAVPLQIFEWAMPAEEEFQHVAAAGSILLLTVLPLMNAVAILTRNR